MTAECIAVSQEMVAVVGRMTELSLQIPRPSLSLVFDLDDGMVFRVRNTGGREAGDLVLHVTDEAVRRIFGFRRGDGDFHLPESLRQIAIAIRDCPFEGSARTTFRLAKSIELLCEAIRMMSAGSLKPLGSTGVMSLANVRRLSTARRLIDERYREKITIADVARGCGMNRNALTRGFKELYDVSVAEAIARRRLETASVLLRNSEDAISAIGYGIGYLNNAAFSRAFARRFGMSPREYRASGVAA